MQMAEMLADWNISKTLCLIAAAGAANVLQAKTVAWYRFEENGPGVVATSETRFTNSVDAAKFPAYAGVCNSQYSPHAQLFIDDDADLRLQTFTLERLVKAKNGNAKL